MASSLLLTAPSPPAYEVPWAQLAPLDWVRALAACPQDPVHHAEGDVATHTRMVLETLVELPAYRALRDDDRLAVYLACLLHDVAKPQTTRVDDEGRVTAKGHSKRGELVARRMLWEAGLPFRVRETVCGLIRHHQVPFFLIERPDPRRLAAEISLVARCDLLALVAEADIRGRVCADLGRVLDNIELYREYCRDEGCYDRPRPFASDHTRFLFFHAEGRHPDVEAYDDTAGEVVVMSGLPGSGKDTFVRQHFAGWPVVSLDALREEYDVAPTDDQGQIVQAARERAREFLRRGERFVWNATNITRRFRTPVLALAAGYRARLRVVYLEAPRDRLFEQNRRRPAAVPERAIRSMIDRWEVPDLTEAHAVEYHPDGVA
ncbi:MAG TPA: AAA family ATPase [Polyangiaceae bacterium]|nr:AAA family ATPase [Polyangiaceae bacterium]